MNHLQMQLLDSKTCEKLLLRINQEGEWQDGARTAGSYAKAGKRNLQMKMDCQLRDDLHTLVEQSMWSNPAIKGYCLPRKLHRFLISKTDQGGGYESHVDNAFMSSGRSDLSFTLSLTNDQNYEGGELEVDSISESHSFKLKQGEIIIYPSTQLHSVAEVNKGERYVCVGWIQSYIQNNEDRNFLFGLDAGAKGLLTKHGRSDELDLIFQAYSNLLRRLGD